MRAPAWLANRPAGQEASARYKFGCVCQACGCEGTVARQELLDALPCYGVKGPGGEGNDGDDDARSQLSECIVCCTGSVCWRTGDGADYEKGVDADDFDVDDDSAQLATQCNLHFTTFVGVVLGHPGTNDAKHSD